MVNLNAELIDQIVSRPDFDGFLDFSGKNFEKIEPDAFKNCKQIKSIQLHHFHFDRKHSELFESLSDDLEELDLFEDSFHDSIWILNSLKRLQKLSIRKCKFEELIDKQSTFNIGSLKSLELIDNPIGELDS